MLGLPSHRLSPLVALLHLGNLYRVCHLLARSVSSFPYDYIATPILIVVESVLVERDGLTGTPARHTTATLGLFITPTGIKGTAA